MDWWYTFKFRYTTMIYEIGDQFKLKASYCYDNICSDKLPCNDCLDMCNTFTISSKHKTTTGYDYFFGGFWANINGGHTLDTPMCCALTNDAKKVDPLRYIHHINETIKIND